MKVTLAKDFEFEAAQALPSFPKGHKCRGLHGHSFKLTVSIMGEVDPQTGIFYDHALISKAMAPLLQQVDHAYLNEIPGMENPTIECMAHWFWTRLSPHLPGLAEITLWETSKARCIYRGG